MRNKLTGILVCCAALVLMNANASAHIVDASSVRIDVFANKLRISQTTPLTTAVLASGKQFKKTEDALAKKLANLWQVSIAGKRCLNKSVQHALRHQDTQFELLLELSCDVKGDVRIEFNWLARASKAHHASVDLIIHAKPIKANKRKIAVVPQAQPVMFIPLNTLLSEWNIELKTATFEKAGNKGKSTRT